MNEDGHTDGSVAERKKLPSMEKLAREEPYKEEFTQYKRSTQGEGNRRINIDVLFDAIEECEGHVGDAIDQSEGHIDGVDGAIDQNVGQVHGVDGNELQTKIHKEYHDVDDAMDQSGGQMNDVDNAIDESEGNMDGVDDAMEQSEGHVGGVDDQNGGQVDNVGDAIDQSEGHIDGVDGGQVHDVGDTTDKESYQLQTKIPKMKGDQSIYIQNCLKFLRNMHEEEMKKTATLEAPNDVPVVDSAVEDTEGRENDSSTEKENSQLEKGVSDYEQEVEEEEEDDEENGVDDPELETGLSLDDGFFEVEAIRRKRYRKGKLEYFVKWTGWEESANTWEPPDNLVALHDIVQAFEDSLKSTQHQKRKRKESSNSAQLKKRVERSATPYSLRSIKTSTAKTNHSPAVNNNSQPAPVNDQPSIADIPAFPQTVLFADEVENYGDGSSLENANQANDNMSVDPPEEVPRNNEENEYDPKLTRNNKENKSDPKVTPNIEKNKSGPMLTPKIEDNKSDPKLTRNVEENKSDPKVTPNIEENKSDPKLTPNVEENKSDPILTRNVEENESDPKLTRNNKENKSDPKLTRNNKENQSDPKLTPSTEENEYVPKLTRNNKENKSGPKLTRNNKENKSGRKLTRNIKETKSDPKPTQNKEENKSDPKLSEVKATTTDGNGVNNLAIQFEEAVTPPGNTHMNEQPNVVSTEVITKNDTGSAEPVQAGSSTIRKTKRKSSAKRFRLEDTQKPNSTPDGTAEPAQTGVTDIAASSSHSATEPGKPGSDIVKIVKPVGYTAAVASTKQDASVTFKVKRSDGSEVMVDNNYLKTNHPILLIDYYEQHLQYGPKPP